MKKIDRDKVYEKYDGKCAYCGKPVFRKTFQVDHIIPKANWMREVLRLKLIGDVNGLDNLNPCCRRCNIWKHSNSLEVFRIDVAAQLERARRYSRNFRMAEDFGLVEATGKKNIEFYFEKVRER